MLNVLEMVPGPSLPEPMFRKTAIWGFIFLCLPPTFQCSLVETVALKVGPAGIIESRFGLSICFRIVYNLHSKIELISFVL